MDGENLFRQIETELDLDRMVRHIEAMSQWHRYTGTPQGERFVDDLTARLAEASIPCSVETYDAYTSLPLSASLTLDSGETLRRMVGSGHLVGLSVTGATLSRVEEELETGSALLASLIRVQPHAVYLEVAGNDVAAALEGDGWACWTPQLRQLEDSRTAYNRSSALLSALDSRSGSVRLLLDDGAGTADLLDRLLPRLDQNNYQVRLPVETVF